MWNSVPFHAQEKVSLRVYLPSGWRETECDSEHLETVVQMNLLFSTYFLVTEIMTSARHWV